MTSTEERIHKLLRLATNNPNEEEARSAALKVCQLIVEHQIVLSEQAPIPHQPLTPSPNDIYTYMQQQAVDLQQAIANWYVQMNHNPFKP